MPQFVGKAAILPVSVQTAAPVFGSLTKTREAERAAEKLATSHSEGKFFPEESDFPGLDEEKQTPRFARDDKKRFFRSLFSLSYQIVP